VTELEGAALAVIWRHGPCSAYTVMRTFKASPTPEWSAGAGSIYPLVARLEERGLVAAEHATWGKGTKKLLRLTSEGERIFRSWVSDLGAQARHLAPDPVRTRMHFLDAIRDAGESKALLQDAEQQARALVAELESVLRKAEGGDLTQAMALSGALTATRARLDWLVDVRRRLETASPKTGAKVPP
jgi:DNA-binding PadR family transcriptional regulator